MNEARRLIYDGGCGDQHCKICSADAQAQRERLMELEMIKESCVQRFSDACAEERKLLAEKCKDDGERSLVPEAEIP